MDFARLREQNIAKNQELLKQLEIKEAVSSLSVSIGKPKPKQEAKPVKSSRPNKKRKSPEPMLLRRQSSRLNKVAKLDETPEEKRKRELRLMKEEQERLEREEREREAKKPRHQDLDLQTLSDGLTWKEIDSLHSTMSSISSRRTVDPSSFNANHDFDEKEVEDLRKAYLDVKIISRAKVTQDRVYSSLYHPEKTKDLIFFGDKHGQLGIWDACAEPVEILDEDGNAIEGDSEEGGRIYRLQPHWPATSKSSISCIKLDPLNLKNLYTSAYDCTIRSISFESNISKEIFALEDTLISSFDVLPNGYEMWISDAEGGVTHKDLRETKSCARRYHLLETKAGCISVNPIRPETVLVSSNNRSLTLWDTRKLSALSLVTALPLTPPPSSPGGPSRGILSNLMTEIDFETIDNLADSKQQSGVLMAKWMHQKSVSSAYWDPSGTRIVSTSYDDTVRLWNIDWKKLTVDQTVKQYRPFAQLHHNCQTGKWLTVLKSQWNQNPDAFPHFTVGNMNHSLNVISGTGKTVAALSDRSKITAVQAVTCSHPGIVARVASGNASGRCVLWASGSI